MSKTLGAIVLDGVAAELEKPTTGWTQHTWARDATGTSVAFRVSNADNNHSMCFDAWLQVVARRVGGGTPALRQARDLLFQHLKLEGEKRQDAIITWNDAKGRTRQDLVNAARAAAAA